MIDVRVRALRSIVQKNFMGKKTHIHARKGDTGKVLMVLADGTEVVIWDRSGTRSEHSPDDTEGIP